ncbi:MAG: glycosyltransferase family A protein [bacterium]|nr:glycosyltransferase family A protein [bacterium]
MISIIIPAYNAASTVEKCLKSICDQTLQDFEMIVVNDGSTDKTNDKLLMASKKWPNRIKIINQTNQGAPAARNRGFKESKGEFLFFCDADAVLKKDCLEKMLKILQTNPQTSYAYSSFKFGWKTFRLWPFDEKKLKQMPYIHTMSLIRRAHFPGWDESIKKLQDWDLWLTMLEQGHIGVWIPKILFKIIDTRGTISRWLPSFFYKLPWKTKSVRRYEEAMEIIKQKHH